MGEHSKEAVARRCVFDVAAAHHFLLGTHFSGEYRSSSAVIRSDSSFAGSGCAGCHKTLQRVLPGNGHCSQGAFIGAALPALVTDQAYSSEGIPGCAGVKHSAQSARELVATNTY